MCHLFAILLGYVLLGTDSGGIESPIGDVLIASSQEICVVEVTSQEGISGPMGVVSWYLTGKIVRTLKGNSKIGARISVDWKSADAGAEAVETVRRRPKSGEKFLIFVNPGSAGDGPKGDFVLIDPWLGLMSDNAAFEEYIHGKLSHVQVAK